MVLLGRIEDRTRYKPKYGNQRTIWKRITFWRTPATKRCYKMHQMNHLRQSKNGQWEVRVVVPADCRERIGKSNLTRRLGRVTRSEANRLAADIVAEFKAQIEKARKPLPPQVTLKPNRAIAALGRWRDSEIARVRIERFNAPGYGSPSDLSKFGAWVEEIGDMGRDRHQLRQRLSAGMLGRAHDATILSILAENGMHVEANHPAMPSLRNSFAQMLIAVMDAEDAARHGDYGAHTEEAPTSASGVFRPKVTTEELIIGYAAERQPPPATLARFRRMFAALVVFVGHDDAARFSPEDIVAWKASLLSKGLNANTVKSGYLAGIKAVFAWGAANRKIGSNPATGVTVLTPKTSKVREKSFTPSEAQTILRAASSFKSNKANLYSTGRTERGASIGLPGSVGPLKMAFFSASNSTSDNAPFSKSRANCSNLSILSFIPPPLKAGCLILC